MFDFEIAYFLYKMSRLLKIFEDNKYKSEAFFNAAMAVDSYSTYITELEKQVNLRSLGCVGVSSAKLITEIIKTGKCEALAAYEKKYGIKDYSLILVHGINEKLIRKLFENNIKTFADLKSGKATLENNKNFSKGELKSLNEFITNQSEHEGKYLFSYAYAIGNEIINLVNKKAKEDIISFDFSVWEDKPSHISLIANKADRSKLTRALKNLNLKINEDNDTNKLVFTSRFGINIIISLKENPAKAKKVNNILLGDLHMHTSASDGKHTVHEMARHASDLKRQYIGITDHSYSLKIARGISEVDALRQIQEIRGMKEKGIKILSGIEVEILKDGTLDFSNAVLSKFDYVIAAIHTYGNQTNLELIKRLQKALSNPYVNILAHPTGKLLGRPGVMFSGRKPMDISVNDIISLCKRNHVVIEMNCFPERFDIGYEHLKQVADAGVKVSVGTDSHSAAHLNCLDFAEFMIQKSGLHKDNFINTLCYNELIQFFTNQRKLKQSILSEPETVSEEKATAKDFGYYFKNNEKIINGEDTVIGIDLTGSEAKPSGFAVLKGNLAITKAIRTDEQLIEESLKYNPKVVSIDSPLSYPKGRCCADPGCNCAKYGITRYCERLLSAFGIGVYPCLIPSMAKLTTRGMSLTEKFKARGVKVIESYPGVAQDILSIRRKQKGIDHLINSYKNFGITGDFLSSDRVTHDELDAITSALVGYFYLNGNYVALGNTNENYLIVPSTGNPFKNPISVAVAGDVSVGKTTLAEYLKFKYGFNEISLKDAYKKPNPTANYVIQGITSPDEYKKLKGVLGSSLILIYITAGVTKQLRNYNKLNGTALTLNEFNELLNEKEKDTLLLQYSADFVVSNNASFKDFFNKIDDYLNGYKT